MNNQESKNFVLVVKYECGESGFLTNKPDLISALNEYNEARIGMLEDQPKYFPIPNILEAKLYRLFKN